MAYELASTKNPTPVVFATRNISKGALVGRRDVEIKQTPKAYITGGAVSRIEQVIGRKTLSEIFAGEAISSKRLAGLSKHPPSLTIKPGRVALAVGTDEIAGVAGAVRGGDRVDIFFTDEENNSTSLLFVRIKVLGIGGVYPFSFGSESGETQMDMNQSSTAGTTIVLEVTPVQAKKLTEASERGKIRLALRAFE